MKSHIVFFLMINFSLRLWIPLNSGCTWEPVINIDSPWQHWRTWEKDYTIWIVENTSAEKDPISQRGSKEALDVKITDNTGQSLTSMSYLLIAMDNNHSRWTLTNDESSRQPVCPLSFKRVNRCLLLRCVQGWYWEYERQANKNNN